MQELDACLAQWFQDKTAQEACQDLQLAGVSAAAVQTATDVLYKDAHLQDRDFWEEVAFEPSVKFPPYFKVTGPIMKPEGHTRPKITPPAPSLGQHTRFVLSRILNKENAWIDFAYANGAVE